MVQNGWDYFYLHVKQCGNTKPPNPLWFKMVGTTFICMLNSVAIPNHQTHYGSKWLGLLLFAC